MQIFASPLVVGLLVGAAIYLYAPSNLTLTLGLISALLGLTFGIIWATKADKQKGVVEYMASLSATPEFSAPIEDHSEENN